MVCLKLLVSLAVLTLISLSSTMSVALFSEQPKLKHAAYTVLKLCLTNTALDTNENKFIEHDGTQSKDPIKNKLIIHLSPYCQNPSGFGWNKENKEFKRMAKEVIDKSKINTGEGVNIPSENRTSFNDHINGLVDYLNLQPKYIKQAVLADLESATKTRATKIDKKRSVRKFKKRIQGAIMKE